MDPRANATLFGHAEAEKQFEAAFLSGRLHHAWLLTGPPGIGKATLAFRMARRLLGVPEDPSAPAFRRFVGGADPDLLTIEREVDPKTRRMRREIAVDQVRAVPAFMHLTPAGSGWRVAVIDGAEEVNRSSANALLKVLEEPPRRAVLILVSEAPGRLLPTIRSRCRRLRLDPLGPAEMDAALDALLPETGRPDMTRRDRERLAVLAEGSPGRALLLAEEGGVLLADLAGKALDAPSPAVPALYDLADRVSRDEASFGGFMSFLADGIAARVRAAAAADSRTLGGHPLAKWGEVWHALRQLHDETERFSLDRRTAVVAGLQLLPRADQDDNGAE